MNTPMKTVMKKYIVPMVLGMSIAITACQKIEENVPDDVFTKEKAINNPQDMQNLLNSCYDAFANQTNGKLQTFNDLLSDDLAKPLVDNAGFKNEVFNHNTNIFNSDVGDLYKNLYIVPFRINSMADLYERAGVSGSEKLRIEAEGKFLRAACHFEAVKLWAHPPGSQFGNSHPGIVLRSEVSQKPKARSTVAESYEFIINDLLSAITNLPPSNGAYANVNAAKALLAKVYYMRNQAGDITEAIRLLNEVIPNYTLSTSLNRFDNAAAQSEYIFATISTNAATDNRSGEFTGKYRSDTKQPDFVIAKELYDLLTDTSNVYRDRRSSLVKVVNPGKDNQYFAVNKFNKDYFGIPYLNLTDMLLTRAELLAETNTGLPQAIDDVNKIIARAYSDSTTKLVPGGANAAAVLAEVRLQRRLELFCEGDRVQTLKRRGAFQDPNLKIRNAPWNCPGMILQFPSVETGQGFEFNASGGCN
jgi:hypothetical protein